MFIAFDAAELLTAQEFSAASVLCFESPCALSNSRGGTWIA